MKAPIVAVVVLVAVLGLGGCTTSKAGTATPGQPGSGEPTITESSPPSSEQDRYGAPRVEHPLDASRFLVDPCAALTPAQLATFGVSRPGKPDTDSEVAKAAGPACIWRADPGVDGSISVSWMSGNKNGLADLYRMRDQSEYFEETTVDGYPAVFNSANDNRVGGDCTIEVGVSDALTFRAGETGTLDAEGACARAEQVAAAAIVTLRGSQ